MKHNDRDNDLPQGCQLIDLPQVADERGALVFAEGERGVPFAVRRVFWIHSVPRGARRGGHAHRTCAEVVVAVTGGFSMVLDDGVRRTRLELDSPARGVLVAPDVWCELCDFQPGTVLVVLASEPYEPRGYVHCYDEYLKLRQR